MIHGSPHAAPQMKSVPRLMAALATAILGLASAILPTASAQAAEVSDWVNVSTTSMTLKPFAERADVTVTAKGCGREVYLWYWHEGNWRKQDWTYLSGNDACTSSAKIVDLFELLDSDSAEAPLPAGTHKFRFTSEAEYAWYGSSWDTTRFSGATSPTITVTVPKGKTKISGWKTTNYTKKTYGTQVPSMKVRITYPGEDNKILLERKTSKGWVTVKTWYATYATSTEKTITIPKITSNRTYRLRVPGTTYVSGATTKSFSVSVKQRSTKVTAKLDSKVQYYKQYGSLLYVTTKPAVGGKAYVYDGKKRIKAFTVYYGYGEVMLPDTLKKGTHKLKVVFKPSNGDAFKKSTSKTLKLKVKK